jgi:ligand-binding sensor domain-containing protein
VFNPHSSTPFSSWRSADRGGEAINVLLEDHRGGIWCGTNAGLYALEKNTGEWHFRFVDLGLRRENFDSWLIETLMEDSKGSLWVGTRGTGLSRHWPDGRTEHFTESQGLSSNRVTSLLEDRTGRVWVGTSNGLCRLD